MFVFFAQKQHNSQLYLIIYIREKYGVKSIQPLNSNPVDILLCDRPG